MHKSSTLCLRQIRSGSCYSYLLYDPQSKEAIAVDPVLPTTESLWKHSQSMGLRLRYIVDTHTHADHHSGSLYLKSQSGATIALFEGSPSERKEKNLKAGDILSLGDSTVQILHVPGHTDDSICLFSTGLVLTGDTLMIAATGRTNFPGSSSEKLYQAIRSQLFTLADETLLYPAHDYNDFLFSRIGVEKSSNPEMQMSLENYIQFKGAQVFDDDVPVIQSILKFNSTKGHVMDPGTYGAQATCTTSCAAACATGKSSTKVEEVPAWKAWEQIQQHLTEVIDVREADELVSGHIPGAKHLPLSLLPALIQNLDPKKHYSVICASGKRSAMTQKTLSLLGIHSVSIAGGMKAWKGSELPVES